MIKCLLSRPCLIAGPLHSTPLQINSQSIPRLDPIDSKSSSTLLIHSLFHFVALIENARSFPFYKKISSYFFSYVKADLPPDHLNEPAPSLSRAASPNKILDRGKIARMKERRACIILGRIKIPLFFYFAVSQNKLSCLNFKLKENCFV